MADTVYEGLFILDANRYSRDPAGVSKQVDDLIEKAGGELLVSRLWEERKLAYPIGGHRKGVYWLTYFRMEGEKIVPLTRQCEIHDRILRQLFIRLHPNLVDTIVSHAQGVTEAEDEEGDKEAVVAGEPAAAAGDAK